MPNVINIKWLKINGYAESNVPSPPRFVGACISGVYSPCKSGVRIGPRNWTRENSRYATSETVTLVRPRLYRDQIQVGTRLRENVRDRARTWQYGIKKLTYDNNNIIYTISIYKYRALSFLEFVFILNIQTA